MAIDNRLQVFNEEGQSVDYDILASDVKFLPDGKDLPTKLAEMEDEIDQAGQGDGTVTGVKVGSDTYEPTEGVVDLSTPFSGKVDKVNGKGLSTNDYTDADKTKLQNLPTADQLTQQMGTKANSSEVVKSISVNGTQQSKDSSGNVAISGLATTEQLTQGLGGKQNVLTFDNAPTAGSNNPVKSGGIKTALDAKANAADVADAIDNALGEAEVTVVPANSVGIITSLGSDSNSDALAASMGKKLKVALLQIYAALGNYAFPDGKPTLDFNDIVFFSVTKAVGTGLSATGGDTDVEMGDSLEVTIAVTNNLYIVDDDSVVVTMGGSPVQGAWNASTMKVTIAAVTGDVVINVPSMTYVDGGHLVVMFDGKNRGDVAGEWTDLKDNTRKLILTNCTENTDSVTLDGSTSTAMAATAGVGVDVPRSSGTIEAVATGVIYSNENARSGIIIANKGLKENGNIVPVMAMGLFYGESFNNGIGAYWFNKDTNATNEPNVWLLGKSSLTTSDILHLSLSSERAYLNGVSLSRASATAGVKSSDYSRIGVFSNVGSNGANVYGKGTMYCARIYDKILSADEVAQNYKVDRKRFNLI